MGLLTSLTQLCILNITIDGPMLCFPKVGLASRVHRCCVGYGRVVPENDLKDQTDSLRKKACNTLELLA